jgi:hypothetical protein
MNSSKLNWQTWLEQGDQYLRASTPKSRINRFGTVIRYNLISMSLESYVMAILDYHHTLPDNHTFTDLITALDVVMPLENTLKKRILLYENIQSICSVEKYHRSSPTEEELQDLTGAITELSSMAHKTCTEVEN